MVRRGGLSDASGSVYPSVCWVLAACAIVVCDLAVAAGQGATAPTGTCEVRVGVSAETAKAWTLDAKVYTANARDNAKGDWTTAGTCHQPYGGCAKGQLKRDAKSEIKCKKNGGVWCPTKAAKGFGSAASDTRGATAALTKKLEQYVGKGAFATAVGANKQGLCRGLMQRLDRNQPVCGSTVQIGGGNKAVTINCKLGTDHGLVDAPNGKGKCYNNQCVRTCGGAPANDWCQPAQLRPIRYIHSRKACRNGGKTWCLDQVPDITYHTVNDTEAVLDLCVTTCMRDTKQVCCMVPEAASNLFPCCRTSGCCLDQRPAQTRRRAQVSVNVAVSVEVHSASVSVYDALLRCLQNPAKLDAMCLTGSSGH